MQQIPNPLVKHHILQLSSCPISTGETTFANQKWLQTCTKLSQTPCKVEYAWSFPELRCFWSELGTQVVHIDYKYKLQQTTELEQPQ